MFNCSFFLVSVFIVVFVIYAVWRAHVRDRIQEVIAEVTIKTQTLESSRLTNRVSINTNKVSFLLVFSFES